MRAIVSAVAAATLASALITAPAYAHRNHHPTRSTHADAVVAADGSGQYTSVQAAVDAAPAHGTDQFTILIKRGVYTGTVDIPSSKPNISLIGATGDARDVVITDDHSADTPKPGGGTYGTSGSATATLYGDGLIAKNITFENSYDEQRSGHSQAVAVKTAGDRMVFVGDRFIGNQDTLYANTRTEDETARQYFRDCYVEGDVDFIFGRATAVFDHVTINALDRGSDSNNGYITAASTEISNPYGFLITHSRVISDAPAKTFHLGRPWPAGGSTTARGQVLFRQDHLPAAIKDAPWTNMSGLDWHQARLSEYRNYGPGAGINDDRPQLTAAQAKTHTMRAYLAGDDGWDPIRGLRADRHHGRHHHGRHHHGRRPLGRQTLPSDDGWAAATGGTTGGADATAAHVYTVTSRAQLLAALSDGDTAKIVRVKGTIDGRTDAEGNLLTCADYAVDGYTLAGYLKAYDPDVWGRDTVPSGPMEDAREASYDNENAQLRLDVPSNTTVVGIGRHAGLKHFTLDVKKVDNVIIRNLTMADATDCFPQWDPTDGPDGNWNSGFDNTEISGATHVWIDHDTFTDAPASDASEPTYFGREYQVHDGLLDIVRASNYVTASWNHLADHDKTMLIGNTDSTKYHEHGKLKVTLHHNFFDGLGQRTPRVRWGQVHVYNNYYTGTDGSNGYAYIYSLGVGHESHIYAESNYFSGIPAAMAIGNYGGTTLTAKNNVVDGRRVDLIAAHNRATGDDLGTDAGWTPTLHGHIDSPWRVRHLVPRHAGAGHLR